MDFISISAPFLLIYTTDNTFYFLSNIFLIFLLINCKYIILLIAFWTYSLLIILLNSKEELLEISDVWFYGI
jgi:hypothetical protein